MEEVDVNKLLIHIKRLEQCISDFKLYDSKRKKYIKQLKNEIENWKKNVLNLVMISIII